jgi:hypothetical protein
MQPAPLDPAHALPSRTNIIYEGQRIKDCADSNPMVKALIAPMPGLTVGDTVKIDDESAFDGASLADALGLVEDQGDAVACDDGEDGNGDVEMRDEPGEGVYIALQKAAGVDTDNILIFSF